MISMRSTPLYRSADIAWQWWLQYCLRRQLSAGREFTTPLYTFLCDYIVATTPAAYWHKIDDRHFS